MEELIMKLVNYFILFEYVIPYAIGGIVLLVAGIGFIIGKVRDRK